MFLAYLNEIQKKHYVPLARRLIAADGVLAPQEKELIDEMLFEMDLIGKSEIRSMSNEELYEGFDGRYSKMIVLIDLMLLAYSDGEYAQKEKELIEEIAKGMRLKEEDIEQAHKWVLRYREVYQAAFDLFAE